MGWLWNGRSGQSAQSAQSGRGKPRSRPRVARAAGAAAAANLGGATALMERASWTHQLAQRAPNGRVFGAVDLAGGAGGVGIDAFAGERVSTDLWLGGMAPARRHDFGDVGQLLERAEDTARRLGRSRAEMWEEALSAWLDAQPSGALTGARPDAIESHDAERAPRPWLFEARRQRVWGEIDETLGALRTA